MAKDEARGQTVKLPVEIRDEEGRKRVEKLELKETDEYPDKLWYIERKLLDKGLHRMERHPADGLRLAHGPPKSGHGGKFTWEGPFNLSEAELDPVPPAIDPRDPNYVEEDDEDPRAGGGGARRDRECGVGKEVDKDSKADDSSLEK